MTQHKRILNDLEIANGRVADLLYDDFNAYQEHFDAAGEDSAHEDLRASFLAWTMTFAPEVFPKHLAVEIGRFVIGAEVSPRPVQDCGGIPIHGSMPTLF